MSERRDDTTERDESSPPKSERRPGRSYYDDDATGYEVYDPSAEDGEEDGDDRELETPRR